MRHARLESDDLTGTAGLAALALGFSLLGCAKGAVVPAANGGASGSDGATSTDTGTAGPQDRMQGGPQDGPKDSSPNPDTNMPPRDTARDPGAEPPRDMSAPGDSPPFEAPAGCGPGGAACTMAMQGATCEMRPCDGNTRIRCMCSGVWGCSTESCSDAGPDLPPGVEAGSCKVLICGPSGAACNGTSACTSGASECKCTSGTWVCNC